MTDQNQKTALVTGAGVRVGRAIAEGLGRAGWRVAVHYNTSSGPAEQTAQAIMDAGGKACVFGADLLEEDQVQPLIDEAADALGPVTCLINNASVFERDEVDTATRESWDRHMEVNLRAPFVLTQALARRLPDGVDGNVINLIDQRVWRLTPHFTSYTVSKAALLTMTKTLAMALAPRIRVNGIAPGPTLKSIRQSEESFAAQVAAVPLKRNPSLDEFVGAVNFILETPSLTGQMIALDGGQHLAWETPDVVGVDE
ncbi:MAG: SDR family oxidoreductase [Alphaproteobacteria bacterium]